MTPISFPTTREGGGALLTGDVFTANGKTWEYDATIPAWKILPAGGVANSLQGLTTATLSTLPASNLLVGEIRPVFDSGEGVLKFFQLISPAPNTLTSGFLAANAVNRAWKQVL